MKRLIFFLYIVYISPNLLAQKPMFDKPLSPRIANYTIDVTLDDQKKMLYATEVLKWTNISNQKIGDLQFHMYLNAFKNQLSTFMKESRGSLRYYRNREIENWGWIDINNIRLENDTDLTDSMRYIQPDDTNKYDQTVLQVVLPDYIMPGETVEINIQFEAQLPEVIARNGYVGDFFMVGQWFPKIGVYETYARNDSVKNGWNCHQYHKNSEFYADFGVYDVYITLPQKYTTGATGVLISETQNEDGTKTLNYYCEDVHDFVWTADTDYITYQDEWQGIKISYLCQPGREKFAERVIGTTKQGLKFFHEWYGAYPYPELTIVEPQYGGLEAGGMEYPAFFATYTHWLIPDGLRYPEIVTIHEFGHQYWYGLVANNEFEEAWLDEGINSYSEYKFMETYYNQHGGSFLDLYGLRVDHTHIARKGYALRNPRLDIIMKKSWEYELGGYGLLNYVKPTIMLMTLNNYLGDDLMKKVMRTYFERYKFRHPRTSDFINTVNEVTAQDFTQYFESLLYDNTVLDYAVRDIQVKKISNEHHGFFESDTGKILYSDDNKYKIKSDTSNIILYHNRVRIVRKGDITFPLEVLIEFENGEKIREKRDGTKLYYILEYKKPYKLVSAQIDPENKILLDINPLNNSRTRSSDKTAVYEYTSIRLFLMQFILNLAAFFV